MSQREDLVKEEDKRLQEKSSIRPGRFTKKLLDDEDYRSPNDEIKRFPRSQ